MRQRARIGALAYQPHVNRVAVEAQYLSELMQFVAGQGWPHGTRHAARKNFGRAVRNRTKNSGKPMTKRSRQAGKPCKMASRQNIAVVAGKEFVAAVTRKRHRHTRARQP